MNEEGLANSWPPEFVFESGDPDQNILSMAMKRNEYPPPVFKRKGDIAALEAADFLAWELLTDIKIRLKLGIHSQRPSFLRFLRGPAQWRVHEDMSFSTIVAKLNSDPDEFERLGDFKIRERNESKSRNG